MQVVNLQVVLVWGFQELTQYLVQLHQQQVVEVVVEQVYLQELQQV